MNILESKKREHAIDWRNHRGRFGIGIAALGFIIWMITRCTTCH